VPTLPLGAAVARLQSARVFDDWSVVSGVPALAIDATGADALPGADALAAAAARLAELPCPSVVLAAPAPREDIGELLAACDVVVTDRDDLERVLAAIVRTPRAAAVLAQVLRAGPRLSTAAGLVLESAAYATLQAGPEFAAWLAVRGTRAVASATAAPVVVERVGDRLCIALNRPDRHNAFSAAVRDALVEALTVAVVDATVREVVLRGNGPSFCSGGDLDEFGTCPDPATGHLIRTTRSPARLLAALTARAHVHVHGACIGAGAELAAFAGRVTAARDAFFALPEVGMGLIPGAGGTVGIPRRIGRQRTAWLALTGDRIDAAAACAWGLVDAISDGP
jgi:enoyl-CoA hydratase/carnithine racemase